VPIGNGFLSKNVTIQVISVFMGVSFTAFRSGYALQVLIRYAHCGLSAAIPHAKTR